MRTSALFFALMTLIGCETIVAPQDATHENKVVLQEPLIDESIVKNIVVGKYELSKEVPAATRTMSKSGELYAQVVHVKNIKTQEKDETISGYVFRLFLGEDILVYKGLIRLTLRGDFIVDEVITWNSRFSEEFDFMFRSVTVETNMKNAVAFFEIEDEDNGTLVFLESLSSQKTHMRLLDVPMRAYAEAGNRFLSNEVVLDRGDADINFSFLDNIGEVEEILVLEWDAISDFLIQSGEDIDVVRMHDVRVYDGGGVIASASNVFLSDDRREVSIGLPSKPERVRTGITLYKDGFRVGHASINWTAVQAGERWVLTDPSQKG